MPCHHCRIKCGEPCDKYGVWLLARPKDVPEPLDPEDRP